MQGKQLLGQRGANAGKVAAVYVVHRNLEAAAKLKRLSDRDHTDTVFKTRPPALGAALRGNLLLRQPGQIPDPTQALAYCWVYFLIVCHFQRPRWSKCRLPIASCVPSVASSMLLAVAVEPGLLRSLY